MKIAVTGAAGFLGWHTRVRLATLPDVQFAAVDRTAYAGPALEQAVADADVVLHIAGINRQSVPGAGKTTDHDEVRDGNIALADRLAQAMEATGSRARIVVAGSAQADLADQVGGPGTGLTGATPYGIGKLRAAQLLAGFAERAGREFVEVRLPNLYGEHGRPDYNSFVATFAHRIAAGEEPQISDDREIPLLHVQDAVADLIAAAVEPDPPALLRPDAAVPLRISAVAERLASFQSVYDRGRIPALRDAVDVKLFNTLRAARWDQGMRSFDLLPHPDARGTFVEVLRQHDGAGQTSFSTTVPGVTRGDHFHFRKIERFVVVAGTGMITLRKMLSREFVKFPVRGKAPIAVDMPTLWTHSITNTGQDEMLTLFWINELYDPADADTHPEKVRIAEDAS